MPRQFHPLVTDMGYAAPIEAAGGVFASSCMATIPDAPLPEGVRVVATNSFKAAHYIVRLTKGRVKVLLEDMDRCVDAVCGARQGGAA
jgi:predicted aconitase